MELTPPDAAGRLDALLDLPRERVRPEHDRNARAVDVGVHQADALSERGDRERQVHRDGRLADAPLRARHGDHVLHARDRRAATERIASTPFVAARDLHDDALDAGLAAERGLDARPERGQRLGLVGARSQIHLDRAAVDPDFGHHPERDDVAPLARKQDRLQRVVETLAARRGHRARVSRAPAKGNAPSESLTLWARSR